MRIVVAIKQVLDPRGMTVNRRAEKVFVNCEEYMINPADRCALEAALQIKDSVGAEVVTVCGGGERAGDALRQAWAMGADDGVHLLDQAFADADALVAARILAAAVHKLDDVGLVLCGDKALDTGDGSVGSRLAQVLDWPQILAAQTVEAREGIVRAVAIVEGQYLVVEAPLPAVVTVTAAANTPRYGNARRVIDSYQRWNPRVWNAADLGLGEGDLQPATINRGQAFPPERQLGSILGSPQELASLLKRQRVI